MLPLINTFYSNVVISNVHRIIAAKREYEGKNNDQWHVSESRTR